MTLITIHECIDQSDTLFATIRFDYGEAYAVSLEPPFSDEAEQLLTWYYEAYPYAPFDPVVDLPDLAIALAAYGEALFQQLFADEQCYACYQQALASGVETLTIEIRGSERFHDIHWEALKDPALAYPLALAVPFVRRPLEAPPVFSEPLPTQTINLLLVAARPDSASVDATPTLIHPLLEGLQQTGMPLQADILRPATLQGLSEHLAAMRASSGSGLYHIVVLDLPAVSLLYAELATSFQLDQCTDSRPASEPYTGTRPFFLLHGAPWEQPVAVEELASLLREYRVPVTLLAGQVRTGTTHMGNRLAEAGAPLVLTTQYRATLSAYELLLATICKEIIAGSPVAYAVYQARRAMQYRRQRLAAFNQVVELEDWLLPLIYQNTEMHQVALLPDELVAPVDYTSTRDLLRKIPAQPLYGFCGRDADMLRIENLLLYQVAEYGRNLLLVQGVGGVGKTTLLQHLAAWWQATGLVEQVFFFSYAQQAWTAGQLVDSLARALYDDATYARLHYQRPEQRQEQVVATLRDARHLIILDNLESITGRPMAIPHSLTLIEQSVLRNMLASLLGGQTLILLGSRHNEEWLMQASGTVLKPLLRKDTIYTLSGLDPYAAARLAEQILAYHGVRHYCSDANLRRLLTLLQGHPLAMERWLPQLASQSPADLLATLPVSWNDREQVDSAAALALLHAVEMVHSNLDATARELLLCLAPFKTIIWEGLLQPYLQLLQQQLELMHLPFDIWKDIMRELAAHNLLKDDPDVPVFLRMHPALTCVLTHEVERPERASVRDAIERSFYQLYTRWSGYIAGLLISPEEKDQRLGATLAQIEDDNLDTVLNLAMEHHASLLLPYLASSRYLEAIQQRDRESDLDQAVLTYLQTYPPEQLDGPAGYEFASVLNRIARRELRLKQYELAEAAYHMALSLHIGLTLYEEQSTATPGGDLLAQTATERLTPARASTVQPFDLQSLASMVEHQERYSQAAAYLRLGNLSQVRQQYELAEAQYQQALLLYTDYNDRYGQGIVYQQLGMMAQEREQWEQAAAAYEQALAIKRSYHDRSGQAAILHQMGRVAEEQRQWIQAERYYQQSLAIKQEFQDRHGQATTYHQLGMVAQARSDWAQADAWYQQALAIYREVHDRRAEALTCGQLGLLAMDQHETRRARDYLLKALEIFQYLDDTHHTEMVFRNLGRLWHMNGDSALPAAVAAIIRRSASEVEDLLLAED